ncbi:hypothetical protein ACIBEJ_34715 [Nonomuraea sp. NPDC050790]|uniref:hypothetical protein n=1 Tax=Nonomuraea sp. NPDC050790 TaxID=3364371 RepID=UPI0037B749B1
MSAITAEKVADWITEYSGDVDSHLGGAVTVSREGAALERMADPRHQPDLDHDEALIRDALTREADRLADLWRDEDERRRHG